MWRKTKLGEFPLRVLFEEVDIVRLTPNWRNAAEILGPAAELVRARLGKVAKHSGEVHVSRIFAASNTAATVSITVQREERVGVTVALMWKPGSSSVSVSVQPMSLRERKMQWFLLGAGLLLGVAFAKFALPPTWDPFPRLMIGLLLGTAVYVGLSVVVSRSGILTDREKSTEMAKRVRKSLNSILAPS